MTDWITLISGILAIICASILYLNVCKLQKEMERERYAHRRAMDYALIIDDILTGATMPEDKRKKLQTCLHYYLAAIGSGDWDLVAKRRDAMDEVLSQSGWEWRVDDRTRRPHPRIRRHRPRSDRRLHPRGYMHARGHHRRRISMARRHRMGMDRGVMQPLTPIEQEIVRHLRTRPMTIRGLEEAMGRNRHDADIAAALDRLKWLGCIRRKRLDTSCHLAVWELMR